MCALFPCVSKDLDNLYNLCYGVVNAAKSVCLKIIIDSPYLIITCDICWSLLNNFYFFIRELPKHEDHKEPKNTRYRFQTRAKLHNWGNPKQSSSYRIILKWDLQDPKNKVNIPSKHRVSALMRYLPIKSKFTKVNNGQNSRKFVYVKTSALQLQVCNSPCNIWCCNNYKNLGIFSRERKW